jgi:hypothetical protein
MSKILNAFFTIIVFVVGISLGMYYSNNQKDEKVVENKKVIDSIQDVVIKNVQAENKEKETIETISNEEKVSPYAKMIVEKKFAKCGHTTVKTLDVPKEIVNLTKKEIEEKYTGWEVKDFSKEQFTLYRVIEANCDDHFVLKENDGYITVYNELTDEISNLIEKTDIQVESLREEDQNDLQDGIKIYGKSELSSLIEDFSS